MPFCRVELLDSRTKFVSRVLVDGASITSACLEFGICRTTGYKWLARHASARGLEDASRRPLTSPCRTPEELVERMLALKAEHPAWGGRKLARLMNDEISSRTIDRLLKARGLVQGACGHPVVGRFQMENPNDVWQGDFKGVPRGFPQVLGCVDDASRFCILLQQVPSQKLDDWWPALWEAFGEFGLPRAMLTDNGVSFRNNAMQRLSSFDLRLLLLGVKSMHGRPRHPQTQGKIERFFGTLKREDGLGREAEFRRTYNEVRPHDALNLDTPAQRYRPSERRRPSEMPSPLDFPDGCQTRRTDQKGTFSWKGQIHSLGRAVSDTAIAVKDDTVYYGRASLGHISRHKV